MPKKFKPIVNDTTVYVQGRLSYANLLTPRAPEGQTEEVYSCAVLIDPKDKEAIAAVEEATQNAIKKGIVAKWNGKTPKKFTKPLQDGDEKENESFHGWVFFNCKSKKAPAILDKKRVPITNADEVYSGMWAIVCVNMFPFSASGNYGVGAGLNAVLKTADDEQLGGTGSGFHAFDNIDLGGIGDDDDEPDMDDDII